jgi:hypothetical protein
MTEKEIEERALATMSGLVGKPLGVPPAAVPSPFVEAW